MRNFLLNCYECIQNLIGYWEYKKNNLTIAHKFKNSNIVYVDYFDSYVLGKWIFYQSKNR